MISILHPSRSRPDKAAKAADLFTEQMETTDYEYILSIDSDDPELSAYHECFPDDRIIIADNHNVVEASNEAAKYSQGEIIVLISDDFVAFPRWDIAILDALEGKSGLLKTFDGTQRWIVTLPVMSRDYYNERGFIYNPKFEHQFCDTEQTHYADINKKLIIRNDILISHLHYSVTKKGKDAVNIKADQTWAQGEREYLNSCREWSFAGMDIYNLSPEAHQAGHVKWLKNKMQ